MKYINGRPAQLNDRVLATGHSGPYIGTVVSLDAEHIKVMPAHTQSAFLHLPAEVLLLADALVPAADIKAVA